MRFNHVALGFGVGLGVGAGGAYLYFGQRPSDSAPAAHSPTPTIPTQQPKPSSPPATRSVQLPPATRSVQLPPATRSVQPSSGSDLEYHPALKYGVPISDYLRFYTNFVSSFDARTRNPQWVLEYLTKDTVSGPGNRKDSDFFEDRAIEERFRSKLSDYRGSGYDRGHMAPAANHKNSQQAMDETFSLSNMSPQVGAGFNRDYWARFEQFVRQLTTTSDAVYVITGPLFLPEQDSEASSGWRMSHPLIGKPPQLVAVPTHYYKVVLAEAAGREPAVGAFIMPNAPVDPATPLRACVISLNMLESAAGVKFFPNALDAQQRRDLDAAAARIAAEGRQQLGPGEQQLLLADAVNQSAAPAPQPSSRTKSRHLCDAVACKLPSERFREGAGGGAGQSLPGGSGGD